MGFFDWLLGGRKKSVNNLDAVFKKIYTLMTNEEVQNRINPSNIMQLMTAGGGIDEVAGATGEFGRIISNPIPVNGPLGELIYISNLVLSNGIHVIGHRLGSLNNIDIFETVTLDGSKWDLLYFDLYHIRKSIKLPEGYQRCEEPEKFLYAINSICEGFPAGIDEAIRDCTTRIIGVPFVPPKLKERNMLRGISRPEFHQLMIKILLCD